MCGVALETLIKSYEADVYNKGLEKLALCFTDINNLTLYADAIEDSDPCSYTISRITYGTLDIICSPQLVLAPRFFIIILSNDFFVVGNLTNSKDLPLLYYIFSRDTNMCMYRYIYNDIREEGYELRFYAENGILQYSKTNYDYDSAKQDYKSLINAYTGGDVFYTEKGVVNMAENEIIFVQEEK